MQSVEKDGEKKKKKKRMKEIIREDSVLVGEKGVDLLKNDVAGKDWNAWVLTKKDFCVEVGWFGGATGAMV